MLLIQVLWRPYSARAAAGWVHRCSSLGRASSTWAKYSIGLIMRTYTHRRAVSGHLPPLATPFPPWCIGAHAQIPFTGDHCSCLLESRTLLQSIKSSEWFKVTVDAATTIIKSPWWQMTRGELWPGHRTQIWALIDERDLTRLFFGNANLCLNRFSYIISHLSLSGMQMKMVKNVILVIS